MRRSVGFLPLWLIFLLAVYPAAAQFPGAVSCIATSESPFVRAEGRSELIGDVLLTCTGGDENQLLFLNVFLFVNVPVTSDLVDADEQEIEALLLIDDPLPDVENESNEVLYDGQVRGEPGVNPGNPGDPAADDSGNVYVGRPAAGAPGRIEWNGVPFRPAPLGESRVFRITNVRVDVTGVADSLPSIRARISATIQNAFALGNTELVVGLIRPSLQVSQRREKDTQELIFTELIADAFRKRIANTDNGIDTRRQQGTPGMDYFTESGLTPDFGGLDLEDIGVADNGTRFVVQIRDVPEGVFVSAPSLIFADDPDEDDPAMIEGRRVLEFRSDFSGGELVDEDDPEKYVPTPGGRANLVYEVIARAPFEGANDGDLLNRFRVPIRAVYAQPNSVGSASVELSYGPRNETSTVSGPAPEPRFANTLGLNAFFPLVGTATIEYVSMRFTPSDPAPVIVERQFDEETVLSDTVEVIAGKPWLEVTPKDAGTTDVLEFSANPVGLSPGTYNGGVKFRFEGTEERIRFIPVILIVNPPPEIVLDTTPINFQAQVGGPAPNVRNLFLGSRNKNLLFTTVASTATGGGWLSVTPDSGRTPVNLRISVNPAGLPPGRYEGGISVRAADAVNTPQIVPVVFVLTPPLPVFQASGIVNAASFLGGGVSPGEVVTIFGLNLGPVQPAGPVVGPDGRLSTQVAGVRVLFDGVPGAIVSVSAGQTSVVTPFNVQGKSSVAVQVEIDGFKSEAVSVPVMPTWPGIFSANSSGQGQGAILNQDGTLNTPSNPAAPGSIVTLYLTGAGITDPPQLDGAVTTGPNLPVPVASVVVRIGGVGSTVEYYGGAPGIVAGVIQINVRVPLTPGSAVPVQVEIGGQVSNIVLVSVAQP